MSIKFGEKLRRLRTNKGITLEELANAIESSKAYVWQLENKASAKPSAELLLKIAAFFTVAPEFFLDDSVDEPNHDQLESAFFRKFQSLGEADKLLMQKIISGF